MNKSLFLVLSLLVFTSFIPFDSFIQPAYADLTVDYLVIAGGGGGGNGGTSAVNGGGGGAGGFLNGTGYVVTAQSYTITVGAGGNGANGNDSIFDSITSTGGGKGGLGKDGGVGLDGSIGGSSGGGGADAGGYGGDTIAGLGGVGTVGQGHNGGSGRSQASGASGSTYGGGGGGAGGAGVNGNEGSGGTGGIGNSTSISGSSVTYATGGNGYGSVAGSANTGNGGGGGYQPTGHGDVGGSGIVVIRYLTGTMTATGGTITTSGSYTIHTFTTSGTFEVSNPVPSAPLNPVLNNMGTHTATASWDTPTDGDNITGYRVYINDAIYENDTESTDTTLPITDLDSGTLQELIVHAWNATGAGTNSSTASNQTINTPMTLDKVNVYNSTAFELFFTSNGTFNGIQVDIDEFPYATFSTLISNSTSSAVTLIVNGITEAIDTAVKIFAHNLGGTSAESNQVINATVTPEVPVLSSSAQTASTITLVMASNNTGSTYNISQSPSGCASFTSLINGTTSPYIASDLSASTMYCFQSFSVNTNGTSTSSNLLNVTTSAVEDSGGGTSGGGTSGGGVASLPQQLVDLLSLSIFSNTKNVILGETLRGQELKVTWESDKDITITKIVDSQSPFDFDWQVRPFKLLADGDGKNEGSILYDLKIPATECPTTLQGDNCVILKKYEVPVTITIVHDGKTIIQDAVVVIDLTDDINIVSATIIGGLAILLGGVGTSWYQSRKPHKKSKVSNGNKKASKSGTVSNSLRK